MFSIPAMETVAEADTPFQACVTLNSENASLAVQLVVSLTTDNGTGKTKNIKDTKISPFNTAISGEDFTQLSEEVTFMIGDADGQERCTNITLMADNLVECEENFTVSLALVTNKPNLSLGTDKSSVVIEDSNCMLM